jgi:predicted nucleic acid-binding protein
MEYVMTAPSATLAFLDTNIWLYAFIAGQDPVKNQKAITLIASTSTIFVSTQVINEVCPNMLRKQNSSEQDIRDFIDDFYTLYTVVELDQAQLLQASTLREKYALSYWDGLIVASALHSSATILYSEDMHEGLIIEQRVQIVNPFK